MKFRRSPPKDGEELRVDARRAEVLVEESREIVVVLDDERRVLAASRRARESLQGLVEGALFPDALLHTGGGAPRSRSPTRSTAAARRCST